MFCLLEVPVIVWLPEDFANPFFVLVLMRIIKGKKKTFLLIVKKSVPCISVVNVYNCAKKVSGQYVIRIISGQYDKVDKVYSGYNISMIKWLK